MRGIKQPQASVNGNQHSAESSDSDSDQSQSYISHETSWGKIFAEHGSDPAGTCHSEEDSHWEQYGKQVAVEELDSSPSHRHLLYNAFQCTIDSARSHYNAFQSTIEQVHSVRGPRHLLHNAFQSSRCPQDAPIEICSEVTSVCRESDKSGNDTRTDQCRTDQSKPRLLQWFSQFFRNNYEEPEANNTTTQVEASTGPSAPSGTPNGTNTGSSAMSVNASSLSAQDFSNGNNSAQDPRHLLQNALQSNRFTHFFRNADEQPALQSNRFTQFLRNADEEPALKEANNATTQVEASAGLGAPSGAANGTNTSALAMPVKAQEVNLTAQEEESLRFLRQKLHLSHPRFTNAFLFRFLQARKFDLEKTADMLRAHLDFRESWRLDEPTLGCRYGPGPPELVFTKLPFIKQHWPHGYHGLDRQGRVIYIERLGDIDVDKIFAEVDIDYLTAYFTHLSERLLVYRHPAATLASERLIDKSVVILDLGGLSYRQMSDSRIMKFLRNLTTIQQNNFPETMGAMFIVNAPYVFSWLWSIIRPWLDPVTIAKFEIIGCDPSAIRKRLTELVAPEQLPHFLGGTCTCPESPGGCMGSDKGPWSDPKISEVLEKTPYWEINNRFFHTRATLNKI